MASRVFVSRIVGTHLVTNGASVGLVETHTTQTTTHHFPLFLLFLLFLPLIIVFDSLFVCSKMSTNSVFNRAADVVRANPDVHNRLGGDMKCYGQDYNTRREGRRFHIPEARFQKDGVEHLRCVHAATTTMTCLLPCLLTSRCLTF